jgi:serine protease
MRRVAFTISALAAIGLAASVSHSAARAASSDATSGTPLTTGRALIHVRTPAIPTGDSAAADAERSRRLGRSNELLDAVARRNGIPIAARSAGGGLIATDLDGGSIDRLRQRLAGDPLVESVGPEPAYRLMFTPNDPAFNSRDPHAPADDFAQWNLLGYGGQRAWDMARGNGGEVAILDTGVDVTHPDLAPRISGTVNCGGSSCVGGSVTDTKGHGTHVAGLACATANNSYGISSVGFGCSIYAVKLGFALLGDGITETSIVNGIRAAADHGVDAINMSFGCGAADSSLKAAIDYAWARGAVPVAAADNNPDPATDPQCTYPDYPAQYVQADGSGPNLNAGEGLVVTSASHSGLRSSFAQKTAGVSVAAFGSATDLGSGGQQGILSTWPAGSVEFDSLGVRTSVNGDNRFAYLSGTSMSAPQVSGLVALMRSAKPGLTPAKIIRLIKLTASNCGHYGGGVGWGVIRADRAVGAALGKDVDPPSSQVKRARRGAGRHTIVLTLKSSDRSCSAELPVSGVKSVAVFASANGGPYRRIGKTAKGSLRFHAKPGRRYRFYSVAVDEDGNREAAPPLADAKFRMRR